MNFLTLDEYLTQARKIILAQKCGFLIKDEDAVAHVAHRMMVADQTWDSEKSSQETWRYDRAKYAIMRIIDKKRKQNKKKVLSLDYGWQEKELGDGQTLIERVQETNHEQTYEKLEEICKYARKYLNDNQFTCLVMRYRDHMTLEEIGNKMGVSKQRVDQHLQKAIRKLKKCMSNIDL
jgi:RNA polymerase sigma factor (sigma-70 family)